PGRRPDADGAGFSTGSAPVRQVRGADRLLHTCALGAGAGGSCAGRCGVASLLAVRVVLPRAHKGSWCFGVPLYPGGICLTGLTTKTRRRQDTYQSGGYYGRTCSRLASEVPCLTDCDRPHTIGCVLPSTAWRGAGKGSRGLCQVRTCRTSAHTVVDPRQAGRQRESRRFACAKRGRTGGGAKAPRSCRHRHQAGGRSRVLLCPSDEVLG